MIILLSGILFSAQDIFAAPLGPSNITIFPSETFSDNLSPKLVTAQAGNVTQLLINDTRVTSRWQGYYGNVTGNVILSDASNSTLYKWNLVPSGEVYAANSSSIDWASVKCVNFSSNLSDGYSFNLSGLERFYSAGSSDVDGIDETFNDTYVNSTGFMVGSIQIETSKKCPLTYTFINSAYQTASYPEVILTDNTSIIYTTLLERSITGFNGRRSDFQMLVAENGNDPAPTNYYFYIEVS